MKCPYCGCNDLDAKFIQIGSTMERIGPYTCEDCGAIEIGFYDISQGKRPTDYERSHGFFQGVHNRYRRQNGDNQGRNSQRGNGSLGIHATNASGKPQPLRRAIDRRTPILSQRSIEERR